ncbi:MAG: MMPL family transporter [Myxococcota bacterium]
MSRAERRSLVAGLLVLAALGAFVAARFDVTTDITTFLPSGDDRELAALSRQVADSELSRTMVLTVGAPAPDTAVAASREFERALRADARVAEELAFLEGGPPAGIERAVWELYHPRRLGFLASSAEQARARLTDGALADAARRLRRRLAQPTSPLLSRLAPSDPLLVLPGLFDRLEGARASDLAVRDGRFVTGDGTHAVLFLGTRARAFDSEAQAPLLRGMNETFASVNARFGGALDLDASGVNRFAVRAEQAIRADIQRVSILSLVGLAVLFLLLFRSLRLVGLASIPIGAGVVAGCAATLALYGRIHGITLAFGASLIGVAIDYVVHFYCHHAVAPHPDGPLGTLGTIRRALVTGAATTAVGLVALGGSSLPGLREVAVFSTAGVLAALLATRFLLPGLVPRQIADTRVRRGVVRGLGALLARLRARRRALWALPAAAVVFVAVGLPRVQWNDDFASLGRLDPELLAEDRRVRERVTRFEQMRFVVALGPSEDEALEVNDRVAAALEDAQAAGEVEGFRNLAGLLPSPSQQRAVAGAVRASPDLAARVERAFAAEGFRPEALAPFRDALESPPADPLAWDDLAQSPLAPLVRPFRVELGDRVGIVSFLHGVTRPEALQARVGGLDGAVFLDQSDLLGRANRAYQQRTVQLLGIGLLGVLLLLGLRYRDPRRAAAAFVPSVLAAGVTVAALALAGQGLDLVALTSLLLVVSMGVDYGVFLVDAEPSAPRHLPAALLSVLVACLSTVIGFGLLALSEHPVLFSIGLTAAVGMIASLLLAPTTLVLLVPRAAASERGADR